MRKLIWIIGLAGLLVLPARADSPAGSSKNHWLTNFAEAQKTAQTTNHPILLDFTGSDWCPWCIKQDKEIYESDQFAAFASQNLILVKLDFPQSHPQPPEEAKQNDALQKKYQVEGFPTTIVLSPQGSVLGRFEGFQESSSVFIPKLSALLPGNKK
jgi:thiol:disulfide interchange protein